MEQSMNERLRRKVSDLGERLASRGERLCTAESCTGGWIGQAVTSVSGSSAWFDSGFVTYSNEAKMKMLGVKAGTLDRYGAVSAETVREMAAGALAGSRADWAVAVSGVAGPDGGTADKPVGLVWLAWMRRGSEPQTRRFLFDGDRDTVRLKSVEAAVEGLLDRIGCRE